MRVRSGGGHLVRKPLALGLLTRSADPRVTGFGIASQADPVLSAAAVLLHLVSDQVAESSVVFDGQEAITL